MILFSNETNISFHVNELTIYLFECFIFNRQDIAFAANILNIRKSVEKEQALNKKLADSRARKDINIHLMNIVHRSPKFVFVRVFFLFYFVLNLV